MSQLWDCAMNPKNTIKKLTTHFKLISILKINKFPKSSYHYWIKKMGHEDPDQEQQINHKKLYRLMKNLEISCIRFSHKTRKYHSYKGTVES